MGDINFNIAKDVNLNKTVNLNIDKNVDVNVNIDDLLATAEADAEAFGTFALAEVDAYTYVSEGEPGTPGFESSGFIDMVGNGLQFDQFGDLIPSEVVEDFDFPEFITQTLADVDDINAPGEDNHLGVFDNVVTTDTPISGEKQLEFFQETSIAGILQAEYQLVNDFILVLPPPSAQPDMDGDSIPGVGPVTLFIPEDSFYEVEFLVDPVTGELEAKEFEYISSPGTTPGVDAPAFLYDDTLTDVFAIDIYVQIGEEILGTGISDWGLEATYNFEDSGTRGTPGEAFAYAESTSAVDLDPIM